MLRFVTLLLFALVCASTALAQEEESGLGVEASIAPEPGDRAEDSVEREELEERIPRSAPDALREIRQSVQQVRTGRPAPMRALTGQQVVPLTDPPQQRHLPPGPNQYAYRRLARSIASRSRGSVDALGIDALGGAILAIPATAARREPSRRAPRPG
jgi:hypothetical protein